MLSPHDLKIVKKMNLTNVDFTAQYERPDKFQIIISISLSYYHNKLKLKTHKILKTFGSFCANFALGNFINHN